MRAEVQKYLKTVNVRSLQTNTQRALYRLLTSNGWVSNRSFRIPSASRRIRDLRSEQYGSFEVECRSAISLEKKGDAYTFYYRLNQDSVTLGRVRRVFG